MQARSEDGLKGTNNKPRLREWITGAAVVPWGAGFTSRVAAYADVAAQGRPLKGEVAEDTALSRYLHGLAYRRFFQVANPVILAEVAAIAALLLAPESGASSWLRSLVPPPQSVAEIAIGSAALLAPAAAAIVAFEVDSVAKWARNPGLYRSLLERVDALDKDGRLGSDSAAKLACKVKDSWAKRSPSFLNKLGIPHTTTEAGFLKALSAEGKGKAAVEVHGSVRKARFVTATLRGIVGIGGIIGGDWDRDIVGTVRMTGKTAAGHAIRTNEIVVDQQTCGWGPGKGGGLADHTYEAMRPEFKGKITQHMDQLRKGLPRSIVESDRVKMTFNRRPFKRGE